LLQYDDDEIFVHDENKIPSFLKDAKIISKEEILNYIINTKKDAKWFIDNREYRMSEIAKKILNCLLIIAANF
jgi:hypothetical protein